MKREVQLLINKSEITAGTRGASLGPEAMMVAARCRDKDFFSRYPMVMIPDVNYYLDQKIKFPRAKRIAGLAQVFGYVSDAVKSALDQGKFPVVLAGDHGSAGGTIAGLKAAAPEKRLGVVWIDAHADIHTPYTTPSGNMHGMPLATALGIDNREEQINDPSEEALQHWQALKDMGVPGPKLLPEDLIYIGVRDTEPQEDAVLQRFGIRNYTVETVRAEGAASIAEKVLAQLASCDMMYISFDVDSMDPEHTSNGTGTPVANGLWPEEAEILLTTLAVNSKTACIEFVEVNPCLDDRKNCMGEIAFDLLEKTVNSIEK